MGTIIFTLWPWPCSLIHFLKTLTLLITFEQWGLELWYFTCVFLVISPFSGYHYFLPCDLDLVVWPIFENFNLAYNFWTVSAKALIFHMSISCDFFTQWPWPWSLAYFFKTLTLLITFELWVLELWYFTWVFLVIKPIRWYHNFWPCDLDLRLWIFFKNWILLITFELWVLEPWYFTWISLVMRSFCRYLIFWPWHLTN